MKEWNPETRGDPGTVPVSHSSSHWGVILAHLAGGQLDDQISGVLLFSLSF